MSKTKDPSIDFRRKGTQPDPTVHSETVKSVDHYNYLETTIDSNLKFSKNCDIIFRKGQQCLHFLRKLRSFNGDQIILTLFYRSFIQIVLTFSIICWCGNLSVSDKKNLQKLVNICSRITSQQLPSLANVYDRSFKENKTSFTIKRIILEFQFVRLIK